MPSAAVRDRIDWAERFVIGPRGFETERRTAMRIIAKGGTLRNNHKSRFTCISMKVITRPRERAILGQVSDLDLRLLRVFKVVADCGGMVAAELELNIGSRQ